MRLFKNLETAKHKFKPRPIPLDHFCNQPSNSQINRRLDSLKVKTTPQEAYQASPYLRFHSASKKKREWFKLRLQLLSA
jgi:hypothetical protein